MYFSKDIIDKENTDWWMNAEVRTRMTFAANNPVVRSAKQLVKQITQEMNLLPSAVTRQKKEDTSEGVRAVKPNRIII